MSADSREIVSQGRAKGNVIIHTDGSCYKNPGFCGAGISIEAPSHNKGGAASSGKGITKMDVALAFGKGTNNYVELRAVGEALKYASKLDAANDVSLKGRQVRSCPIALKMFNH